MDSRKELSKIGVIVSCRIFDENVQGGMAPAGLPSQ